LFFAEEWRAETQQNDGFLLRDVSSAPAARRKIRNLRWGSAQEHALSITLR
jgi:hypothetical protein